MKFSMIIDTKISINIYIFFQKSFRNILSDIPENNISPTMNDQPEARASELNSSAAFVAKYIPIATMLNPEIEKITA